MMRFFLVFLAGFVLQASAHALPSDELYEKLKQAETEQAAILPAQDVLAALLESGSGTVDLLMERSTIAAQNNDLQLARELLDRVIAISPDYTEGWFQRSALFLSAENYGEALRDLNEVLKLEPRHFPAWYRTASILESLGSRTEAIEAYEKAIEIHPHFALAKRGVTRLTPSSKGQSL